MNTFKQLYDPRTATLYSLDRESMILTLSSGQIKQDARLKPYQVNILLDLFCQHPSPVTYTRMTSILKKCGMICSDETRLHRKVSELRNALGRIQPDLKHLICNTRGVGYSLPLHLRAPDTPNTTNSTRLKDKKQQNILTKFYDYLDTSIKLSKKCKVVRLDDYYILNRKPVHKDIEILLNKFEKDKKLLLNSLKLHQADFLMVRIDYFLALLKTYLGLARISEFSISKEQWVDWHESESRGVLEELTQILKSL